MISLSWYKVVPENVEATKDAPGVYVFSARRNDGKYRAVYVGQSTALRSRLKQHLYKSEQNEDLKNFLAGDYIIKISYAYARETQLDVLEKYLISHYAPQFNCQDGNGDSFEPCSLPNVT